MSVPMYDHVKLYRANKAEYDAAAARVMASGRYDWGSEVPAFEAEFVAYIHARHAVGVGSGSAALRAALRALSIGAGDEVVTVANTDLGGSGAISNVGATVVWVDIDPVTRCIDPSAAAAAITGRTRAILAVDMYGHPADIPALRAITTRHGLALVQDACLSLGAEIAGTRIGSLADVSCFSFSPGKHLGAFGSGGACATEDPVLAERIRRLSADGQDRSRHYAQARPLGLHHETDGENSRLHEIQAAILRVKLPTLDAGLVARRAQAARYAEALAGLPLTLPQEREGCLHAWRNYVIEVGDRATLAARLFEAGIATNALYAPPMHLQPLYAHLDVGRSRLPVTEQFCERLLGLPIGPHLTLDDIDEVAAAVRAALC
jgi:dTDP-3-amino-3,4,6-trideoxy-alpha-D-glucose transaminase